MTEINTPSKVTKLNKAPETICEQNDDILNEKTCLEEKSSKHNLISESISKISNYSKRLFSAKNKKIKAVSKILHSEKGIKYIITGSIAVVCLIACFLTCSIGYKVSIGDKTLGFISSKDIYNESFQEINENVFNLTGKEFIISEDAKLSMAIAQNKHFQTKEQFKESLKSTSYDMIPAYTILIDNKMVVSLPNEEMAYSTIEEYKNSFSTGNNETNIEFLNDINIAYIYAPKDLLHSKDSAVSYLLNGEFTYYKSDCKQTISQLSKKTGVAKDEILKKNSLDGDIILKDQIIKLYTGKMFANVKSVQNITREEAIPYETLKKNSGEIYKGITKTETSGTDGVKSIDEAVTYINGKEVKREVLNETILKAPTTQVELIGTKEPPPSVGTGNLVMPTNGSLSSRFGSRWGRQHKGIDVSAAEGTPVYAADNGTVTYSQFNNGGYGYMIQIDHSNGIKTYYAHCSELLVKVGDVVAKGDLIATVGNTGRSTGAHLHFEVLQNGVAIDPMTYID